MFQCVEQGLGHAGVVLGCQSHLVCHWCALAMEELLTTVQPPEQILLTIKRVKLELMEARHTRAGGRGV